MVGTLTVTHIIAQHLECFANLLEFLARCGFVVFVPIWVPFQCLKMEDCHQPRNKIWVVERETHCFLVCLLELILGSGFVDSEDLVVVCAHFDGCFG